MKIANALVLLGTLLVFNASAVTIETREFGSGSPGLKNDTGVNIVNDIYHAPQYMPGYPTAASLWARVVDVPCTKLGDELTCKGYNWLPEMGRGEYLFFRPIVEEPKVVQTAQVVPVPAVVVETPIKKFIKKPVKKIAKRKICK
jgi:hypothetical protein